MQRHGFDPHLRSIFPVEGIFPLELTWILTPFPQNYFEWEYKPRSSVCTHAFHRTDSKDPDIYVLDGWMPVAKTHPVCTIHEDRNGTTSVVGLRNGHICKNVTQNGEPQRSSWGTQKKNWWIFCVRDHLAVIQVVTFLLCIMGWLIRVMAKCSLTG